jgi:hypothetical protein
MFAYICIAFFSFGLGMLAGVSLIAWRQKKMMLAMFGQKAA